MVKIYGDCAYLGKIEEYSSDDRISGITTNPSILKKSGVTDYLNFAKAAVAAANKKPISLEVLSDDWDEMERQADTLQSLGDNVYVKIPITNTKGESSFDLIYKLLDLNLNVTAVMTRDQIVEVWPILRPHHILSIFVGRINDAGWSTPYPRVEALGEPHRNVMRGPMVLWASARQVYSVIDAQNHGYDIITLTPDLIAKLPLKGKDLKEYSLETVKQFYEDGKGLTL